MGEVFSGRYELIDPLGEGGVGVVWRAWDARDERYVAAKVLRQVDAASLLRFVREQGFRIRHEHVVMPLSWAGDDDRVLFTMPLVRGGSVATLIGDFGPLPPPWVATLLDQLFDALDAIHAAGLVHRDVKPANLLLEPTGRDRPHLRLSDFGIAAALDHPRLTSADVVLGTRGYVAPESVAGADPEPRQDLYAAGMSAVEMLTGSRPEPAGEPNHAAALLDGGSRLEAVLLRLIARDPDDRPATAAEARGLLAVAGLVVESGPMPDHDVEVLDHLVSLPDEWPELEPGPTPDAGPGAGPDADPVTTARPRGRLLAGVALAAAGLLLLFAAFVLDV